MKRLLFALFLFISFAGFSQKVVTYSSKALTYSNKVLTYTAYCSEFQTVYDAFTVKPDATRAGYYNTAVKALVDGGYWTRIDLFQFYAYVDNTSGDALINWISPGACDGTAYNAPTHTADQGFQFNGTTQYVDANFKPSVNGVNYTQNSASQILYIRTNITSIAAEAHGINNNTLVENNMYILQRYTGNKAYIKTNDNTSLNNTCTNGSGMFINTRTAAAINKLYQNKVAIINGTTASTGVPTRSFYVGARNDNGIAAGFRADEVALFALADGFSQIDVNNFSDIVNACMTSLGTNVY